MAGNYYGMIHQVRKLPSIAKQADSPDADFPRGYNRLQDVFGVPTCADRNQHIILPPDGAHLPFKYPIVSAVIRIGSQEGGIGGQGNCRQSRSIKIAIQSV